MPYHNHIEVIFMKKTLISSVLLLFALTITACGSDKPSREVPPEILDNSGFKNVNNMDEFEIHTERQLEFLNYDGSYAKMDKSLFPDGKEHLSDSLPITLTWNYELPEANEGKEVEKYSVIYGQEKDLSDGYRVDSPADKDEITFSNPYLGENYYKLIATYTDGSTDESPIKIFRVNHTYPRNLTIEGMTNCRDIGGRATVDGGMIKQGLIFRTSGKNQNGAITDATKEEMLNHLKLKNEINLAGDSSSYNLNLEGTTLFTGSRMDTSSTGGYSHISRNTEAVKNFFNFIADENNYPLFYHCRIGTDRTGICAMAINGLLGVPFNECIQDYCFSNFGKIDGQRYTHKESDPNGDDPAKYIDEILAMPGKNFQEQTYNALLSIGISAQTLNKVINILTEGNKATLPSTAKVGKGSDLSSSVSKSSNSDYTHPEAYYALSSGKSVEYTANLTAGEKDIVVYLGSTDSSNSTKLANCIALKIDGAEKTITNSKTLYTAGFGITKGGRTGYMFNMLGLFDLTAGNHTITIAVKSGTFNIGTICVFDHVTA